MLLALSRPVAAVAEPRREGTVILAFDVSTSMAAKDMQPSRLGGQGGGARFVEKQPSTVKIGVVAFGGNGIIAQQPTTDKDQVLASFNRLAPQGETSLGRGILTSLSAIAGKPILSSGDTEQGGGGETPIGYYGGTAIVLLTDGENTSGPSRPSWPTWPRRRAWSTPSDSAARRARSWRWAGSASPRIWTKTP